MKNINIEIDWTQEPSMGSPIIKTTKLNVPYDEGKNIVALWQCGQCIEEEFCDWRFNKLDRIFEFEFGITPEDCSFDEVDGVSCGVPYPMNLRVDGVEIGMIEDCGVYGYDDLFDPTCDDYEEFYDEKLYELINEIDC